jgi:hypothetical protein
LNFENYLIQQFIKRSPPMQANCGTQQFFVEFSRSDSMGSKNGKSARYIRDTIISQEFPVRQRKWGEIKDNQNYLQ